MLVNITQKIKSISSYFYRNYTAPRIYSIRDRKILSRNTELKNKYSGQRCFIIGGGPSIANIDLARLADEQTFVVNEFEKNAQYNVLKPKFHVYIDTAYFAENTSYWHEQFKKKDLTMSPSTTLLINLGAKQFIEKNGMFKSHKVYYIGMQGIMGRYFDFNIDISKYVPWPKNSILLCIMAAAYMGFKEIYLLGCEHNFLEHIKPGKNTVVSFGYGYEDELLKLDLTNDDVIKAMVVKREQNSNYSFVLANILQLFKNYEFIYSKIRKIHPGIRIYNATPDSYLDTFPKVKFEEIEFKRP